MKITKLVPWLVKATGTYWGEYFFVEVRTDEGATGSRGATTNVVSGIDIALWDIRGKVLGQPVYDLLGGRVRDDILLYTHPNSRNFATDDGVVQEIRAIVDSGHTALKFDPFPHSNRIGAADDIYLDGGMSRQGEEIAARL